MKNTKNRLAVVPEGAGGEDPEGRENNCKLNDSHFDVKAKFKNFTSNYNQREAAVRVAPFVSQEDTVLALV